MPMNLDRFSDFLEPQLRLDFLDLYWIRKSILNAVKKALPDFEGTLLDIGCGQQPYRGLLVSPASPVKNYIGLDLYGAKYGGVNTPEPDLRWDGKIIPLEGNSIDTAFATEMLEHCLDPIGIFEEIHRVLRPGGRFFFTVPFLWPIHDAPNDYYRYTPFALEKMLKDVGFTQCNVEALGGWDASLGQMLGLWITRRPISNRRIKLARRLLSAICFPIIYYLYSKDCRVERQFDNTMLTGISCTVIK